jgi:hypothetical protein
VHTVRVRLPRRPVRSLFRFLFRALWAAVAVGLDLDPPQREEAKPRAARQVAAEARRDR